MTPEQIIDRLYSLGHFHNPKYPNDIEKASLVKLTLNDHAVKNAIRSYQEFMKPDLDMYSEIYYRHDGVVDGEVGPATDDLLEMPRCGFPDYPMPEGVLPLNSGPLESNWPTACRGRLRFGRNFRALPGSSEAATHGAMWASCNNWSWALQDVDMVAVEPGGTGLHRWAGLGALSGSTLAWSYLARSNCNVSLEQRYNTRTNWSNQVFAATVISHEDGHALGLHHNNDRAALMYPSIHAQSQARAGYPNATDLRSASSLGYALSGKPGPPPRDKLFTPRPWGEPEEPPPEPETEPPQSPDENLFLTGIIEAKDREGRRLGRFIFIPYRDV